MTHPTRYSAGALRNRFTPPHPPQLRPPLLLLPSGRDDLLSLVARVMSAVEVRPLEELPAPGFLDPERPTVLLADRALLQRTRGLPSLPELSEAMAIIAIGDPGDLEPASCFATDALCGFLPERISDGAARVALRAAFRHAATQVSARTARRDVLLRHNELEELTRLGVALSTERDLLKLLEMILDQARRLTTSDAGSLYLVEREGDGDAPTQLRFKLTQNFSLPDLPFHETTVPIDHASLAGYTASTGEPLAVADVYLLPDDAAYRQNRSFDEKFGYRTKSVLVIPMRTHRDEIIGVLQLINRKRHADVVLASAELVEREVIEYDDRLVELVSALASQAAVAIENSLLYEDIERLFEGFVTAAVTAIEARDPTTSGHSGRVATLTVGLAEAVDRGGEGAYRAIRFTRADLRELRYASLLHDFGKVGVREQVLVKEKKLYPQDLDLIRHRFAYLQQAADLAFERERAEYLLQHGPERYQEFCERLAHSRRRRREELARFYDAIMRANEPTVLPEGSFEELRELNARTYIDFDGVVRPLLTDDELQFLMIRKGNLDEDERREIESHVTHTYRFLEQIPWTRELRRIPDIAYAHHEKLNGMGYPRAITGESIPVQARMMTISDIFDALTATDRPYKRAVPFPRALDILRDEAKEGMLDRDLLETFIAARIYESVAERGAA